MAEAPDLSPGKCGFESHRGHNSNFSGTATRQTNPRDQSGPADGPLPQFSSMIPGLACGEPFIPLLLGTVSAGMWLSAFAAPGGVTNVSQLRPSLTLSPAPQLASQLFGSPASPRKSRGARCRGARHLHGAPRFCTQMSPKGRSRRITRDNSPHRSRLCAEAGRPVRDPRTLERRL
jgi:hypothetical protein